VHQSRGNYKKCVVGVVEQLADDEVPSDCRGRIRSCARALELRPTRQRDLSHRGALLRG
jgi:hypothetical protein